MSFYKNTPSVVDVVEYRKMKVQLFENLKNVQNTTKESMMRKILLFCILFSSIISAQEFIVDENLCRIINVEDNKGVIDRGSLHGVVKEEKGFVYAKMEEKYEFEFSIAEIEIAEIFPESSLVLFQNVLWPIEEGFLAQVKCKVSKRIATSVFYKLAKNNIFFRSFFDKTPLYDYTYIVQRNDITIDDSLISLLVEEANKSGDLAKEGGLYYIPSSGRFKGIPMDSALTITNRADVIAFLDFVNEYKSNYAGLNLYFIELYAGWIRDDCPEIEQIKSVSELIKDGETAIKTDDYEKAYEIFEKAKVISVYRDYCETLNNYIKELLYHQRIIDFDKENIEAHLNAGISLYYIAKVLGSDEIAHLKYEKVIEIMDYVINKGYPTQIPLRFKGYSLFRLGRMKEALDVFRLILKNYPDDENIKRWENLTRYFITQSYKSNEPATCFKIAELLYESEDYEGAISELKKIIQKGKKEEKEKAIKSIIKIRQNDALQKLKNSIERSFKLRNYSIARRDYAKAESLIIKLDDNKIEKDFKIFYAEQLAAVHRYKEALDIYLDIFSKFNTDEELCINIYQQYINLEKIDSAGYWIEKAVALNNASASAHRVYAHFLIYYTNDIEKGIIEAEKSISLDPENAWVYYQLACGYLKNGDLQKAEANINKAIDLEPEDKDYKEFLANLIQYREIDSIIREKSETAELLFRKGRALFKLYDYKEAITSLKKALENGNKNHEVNLYLARSYQSIMDYETATSIYENLLQIEPDTDYVYSYSLYSYGMQILQKQPDSARGYFLLGMYNLLNGWYDAAYDYLSIAQEKDVESALDIDTYLNSCRVGMKADSFYNNGLNEYNLQNYKEALEYYNAAEELYLKIRNGYGIYGSILQKGKCYLMLYDYDNAITNFNQAESLADKLKEPSKKLYALGAFATMHSNLGNFADAQENMKKYLEIATENDYLYIYNKAIYYQQSADIYWNFGIYDSSAVFYKMAAELYSILRDEEQKGVCLSSLASAYENAGEYSKALNLYKEVLALSRDLREERQEMETYLKLGQISSTLGDIANAMDYFKKALQIANIIGDIRTKGSILNGIGFNYYYLAKNDYDRALTYFEKVKEIGEFLPNPSLQTVAYANIGLCYARKKDFDKAIQFQIKGLSLSKEIKDPYLEVQGYSEISETYYDMKDYNQSLEYIKKAIYLAQKMNLVEFLWNYFYSGGKIFEAKSEIDSAIHYYTESKEIIKRLKAGLTEEAKERYMKGMNREDVFKRLATLLLKKGKSEEAFKVLEESKIQLLKENIEGIAPQTNDENLNLLLRGYKEQVRKIEKVEKMIQEEKQKEKANPYKIDNLSKLLAQTQGEFNNIAGELRDKYYMVYGLMSVQPVELSDIRDTLPPQTAVLEYFVTDSILYIFFAAKKSIAVREISIARELLYKKVEYFLGAIKAKSDMDVIKEGGTDLYQYLIEPFEDELNKYDELIIIPYGYLHYLPFSALIDEKGRYLIEKHSISYINSATFIDIVRRLLATKDLSEFSLLALVDPDGSLPGARAEGKVLQEELFPQNKVLIFKDANRNNFLKEAKSYRIIHLGTHGFLDGKDPSASFIVLNGGERSDKFTIREIRNAMCDLLKKNDLIFLSACNSAVESGNVSVGRELTTLAEAFTMAGSPSLVAGLWEIADEASVKIVKEFYGRLMKNESKATSLKEAQISLLNSSEFSHPFFWAPFVLIGDWR